MEHSPAQGGRAEGWPMYLSVREVAHELRLSRRRIYQLADAGELQRVKIGAATRITSASLLALAQRANAGEQIAEFVRSRPKATVGRKGAGLRGLPRKAPKEAAEHTKPAKPKDTPPQATEEPAAPPDRFGDRRSKAVRKHRRADRAPVRDPAEQEA
jgi:excisionase family DNA binding protein